MTLQLMCDACNKPIDQHKKYITITFHDGRKARGFHVHDAMCANVLFAEHCRDGIL